MAVWYGIIPIAGAYYSRYKWRRFRKRFINISLSPLLDYRKYREPENEGVAFRFTGEIESITDGRILWVKGGDLTIPVSLEKTNCFLLPKNDGNGMPEAPEQIRWNRVSTLNEGVKVFIGGHVKMQDNRLNFISTKEIPLIVIFYNCPETELTSTIIRAARTRNDYWNSLTPISLFIGAASLVYIAASFLNRPAYHVIVIGAMAAVFIPVFPMIPPGLLFTFMYRRLAWYSQRNRAYRDLARLPLRYLRQGDESCILNTGEKYGYIKFNSLKEAGTEIPHLIPESFKEDKKKECYFFGVLNENEKQPVRSVDPFVSFGILPVSYINHSYRYTIRTYALEVLSWTVLFLGILINVIFIYTILRMLGVF